MNQDNVYEQNITLSDGKSTVRSTIRITIRDVDEPPVFQTQIPFRGIDEVALLENYSGPVYTAVATDPENRPVTYSIASISRGFGNYPVDVFEDAFSIDTASGVVSVNRPFDFEVPNPQEAVDMIIHANDGVHTVTLRLLVTLTDIPTVVVDGLRIASGGSIPNDANFASSVGDLDGDGLDDLWISSAAHEEPQAGSGGKLIFGSALRASLAQGDKNLTFEGLPNDQRFYVSYPIFGGELGQEGYPAAVKIGDVNGNGRDDLFVTIRNQPNEPPTGGAVQGLVAVIVPDDLIADSNRSLSLTNTTYRGGIEIYADANDATRDLSVATGDFDGDGTPDIAFGFPHKRQVKILFGSELRTPPYLRRIDLEDPAAEGVVTFRAGSTGDPDRGIGRFLTMLPDVDGDGADELIVSGEYYPNLDASSAATVRNDFQGRVYIVPGSTFRQLVAARQRELLLEAAETSDAVVRLSTMSGDIAHLYAGGDLDNDGVSDIVVAHRGKSANQKTATVIYGSTAALLIPSGSDVSMDFGDTSYGIDIYLSGQQISSDPAAEITVGLLPNLVGGPGDELMIAFPADSPDGVEQTGSIMIIQDQAIINANSSGLTLDAKSPDINSARKLYGLERFGAYLVTADFDGDGIADLSMGSQFTYAAGKSGWGFPPGGGFFMLPGTRIQEIFAAVEATYDLNLSFRVEVAPN